MAGAIIIFMGLVSLGVGIFMGYAGFNSARYVAAIEDMAALEAAAIIPANNGQTGYIEGVLSPENPTPVQNFVAYIRYDYRGERERTVSSVTSSSGRVTVTEPIWREDERHTPALILETDSLRKITVRLHVPANGYSLGNFSTTWVDTDTLEVGVTKKYEAFVPGDTVVAVGEIVADDSGAVFQAAAVHGGNFDDYRESFQSGASFALIAGAILAVVGLILIAVGIAILS